ncbi:hypothetical protein ACRXCV_12070 [Halobacteriovorax sp. GFR7]|uniref:hypothetical protein n=1 Tax=unclassified Halobacteriovorax TaxID=2639665 RepID=UPI003D958E81
MIKLLLLFISPFIFVFKWFLNFFEKPLSTNEVLSLFKILLINEAENVEVSNAYDSLYCAKAELQIDHLRQEFINIDKKYPSLQPDKIMLSDQSISYIRVVLSELSEEI